MSHLKPKKVSKIKGLRSDTLFDPPLATYMELLEESYATATGEEPTDTVTVIVVAGEMETPERVVTNTSTLYVPGARVDRPR